MSPGSVERTLDHVRDFGLRGLHLRFLAGLRLYREMPVYELDFVAHPPRLEAVIPVGIYVLTLSELDEYTFATGHDPVATRILWDWGAICFIARHKGQIVARVWAAERTFPLTYLSRDFVLQPDELYFLDALTLPAFRGNNILGALLSEACRYYRLQGRRKAFTVVFSYNLHSIRGFQKVGFRFTSIRGYHQLGPWRRDFLSVTQ